MSKSIFLFDVDGTLSVSGQKITNDNAIILNKLKENNEIGIVGGGDIKKILYQMDNKITFNHYFSECGCVYDTMNNNKLENKYRKNIRNHKLYPKINILIKKALEFISKVDYTITGHFIDLRCGIIYISLIGMVANNDEREYFKLIDKKENIRSKLINILIEKSKELMLKNGWINPMHTEVPGPDGQLSYGGYCFPKDTNALLQHMIKEDTPNKVLEATINERNEMRKDNTNVKL